jgi:hypothetical protein
MLPVALPVQVCDVTDARDFLRCAGTCIPVVHRNPGQANGAFYGLFVLANTWTLPMILKEIVAK